MQARAEAVEQTRRRIIAAATQLFAEQPFDLVSFARVARVSGIGIATVVRQFQTKEQLFAAAAAAARQSVDAEAASTPPNDPAAAIRSTIRSYESYGDVIVGLLAQEQRVPLIREQLAHGRKVHRAWVETAFALVLGRRRGRARQVRLAQLMAVTDVLHWKLLRRDLGLSRRETERAMLEIVEGLCR